MLRAPARRRYCSCYDAVMPDHLARLGEIHAAGDRALLVEFRVIDAASLHAVVQSLREIGGALAVVAGHSSILVVFTAAAAAADARIEIAHRCAVVRPVEKSAPRRHRLRLSIAGAPDLDVLLASSKLTEAELKDELRRLELTARFQGFLPGWAYLEGLPSEWNLPRKPTSRRVAAGSFAIAAGMAGIYPAESQGGWNVIGRCDALLWDPHAARPNLIAQGDVVSFELIDEPVAPVSRALSLAPARADVEIVHGGQQSIVTRARPDWSRVSVGLAEGGAFDADLAGEINRRAGNERDAVLIESAFVGPVLRFAREATVAWSDGFHPRRNGDTVRGAAMLVEPDDVIDFGSLQGSVRGWIAVSGGFIDPSPRFADRPLELRSGMVIEIGDARGVPHFRAVRREEGRVLDVRRGPASSDPRLVETIVASEWTVTSSSDRVGVRLRCASPIEASAPSELASLPAIFGSVQFHPDGSLIILGPDHPLTGGYLQPVTVVSGDLWKIGQLRHGEVVRFRAV